MGGVVVLMVNFQTKQFVFNHVVANHCSTIKKLRFTHSIISEHAPNHQAQPAFCIPNIEQ
jgi:hypothetical protein